MAQEALIDSPLRDGHKHQNSQALKFLRESYDATSRIEQRARSYPGVLYKLQFSRDTILASPTPREMKGIPTIGSPDMSYASPTRSGMTSRATRRANLASAGARTFNQALDTRSFEYRESESDMTLVTSLQTCKSRLEEELKELDESLFQVVEDTEREEHLFECHSPFARQTMLQLPAKI
mmetsp:Transcript_29577/g.68674  ORF Transcript_29577/g.68674 Transcript_29577/m.68674 type:complete len:180 (-) Transcript_29577:75-614(-)|eukprot:CAMPEP_0182558594 /NCGR_PEP_ID=MMETSP1324-20130603/2046_1 /TAXON_ID=236786 /ORGANISM="Florenciella sp., Strain RCC1587" /LENGTH=179 /DNA_ID=CAMNT_0024770771 /DNA_START=269 /DNA_END=808 /DNA_ORIENTATION=-